MNFTKTALLLVVVTLAIAFGSCAYKSLLASSKARQAAVSEILGN